MGLERMNSISGGSLRRTLRRRQRPRLQMQQSLPKEDFALDDEYSPAVPPSFFRVLSFNVHEWPYMLIGVLTSLLMGAAMPIYAILFGEVLGLLSKSTDEARAGSVYFAFLFVAAGVAVGSAMFFQISAFTVAGERLTLRLRKLAFSAMLRVSETMPGSINRCLVCKWPFQQEMTWHDQPSNSPGALCTRLSSDASAIQGVKVHKMFLLKASNLSASDVRQSHWSLGASHFQRGLGRGRRDLPRAAFGRGWLSLRAIHPGGLLGAGQNRRQPRQRREEWIGRGRQGKKGSGVKARFLFCTIRYQGRPLCK